MSNSKAIFKFGTRVDPKMGQNGHVGHLFSKSGRHPRIPRKNWSRNICKHKVNTISLRRRVLRPTNYILREIALNQLSLAFKNNVTVYPNLKKGIACHRNVWKSHALHHHVYHFKMVYMLIINNGFCWHNQYTPFHVTKSKVKYLKTIVVI